MKTCKLLLLLLLTTFAPLGALDFGLVLNSYLFSVEENEISSYEYRFDMLPRVKFIIGDNAEFYSAARLNIVRYKFGGEENDFSFIYIPELLHTEYYIRKGNWGLSAGRIYNADPIGIVTSGLFDGVRLTQRSKDGTLGIGAYYTGLLYKKSANIAMTYEEMAYYDELIDDNDVLSNYFAPGHFIMSVDWEHPSLFEKFQFKAGITEQLDFSKMNDKYFSQYFTVKASVPYKSFTFELGGSFELALAVEKYSLIYDEIVLEESEVTLSKAFAFDGGVYWAVPTKFPSRLSLTGRYGGSAEKGVFIPITNRFYGNVLKARLPGLSIFTLDYSARIIRSLGTSLSATYFIRNDLYTYAGFPVNISSNAGSFLGPEVFTRIIWNAFSDLQINLGAGLFFPSLGNASPEERTKWYAEIIVSKTLF